MKRFILINNLVRRRAVDFIMNEATEGFEVTVKEPTRNGAQNALLHSLIGEVAAAKEWAGKKQDAEVWKRLLTAAWLRAEGESIQLLPAIDGKGLDVVYTPTHTLSKQQMTSLIEFVHAWMAMEGIEVTA